MSTTTRIPVRTEHRCSRKDCGGVASAYLYEDNFAYRICFNCYTLLAEAGAPVSLIPPMSLLQYPANA
jgi:hypothetical protein